MLQSRQFDLFRKLGAKLLIEDESAQGAPPVVLRGITPVIDVSRLLISEDAETASNDLTGGIGNSVTYFTVPDGERWHMRHFSREVTNVATHLEFFKAKAVITFPFSPNTQNAQFGSFEDIILEERDRVALTATGDPGDDAIFLHIMFGRELLN